MQLDTASETGLPGSHATVYAQRLPGNESCFLTGKVHNGVGDISRDSPSPCRNECQISILFFLGIVSVTVRRNPAGGNHVDRDTGIRKFGGHTPSPANLSTLGGYVRTKVTNAAMIHFTDNVDYSAPSLLFHVTHGSLCHQERAFDKEINHVLIECPVILVDRLVWLVTGCIRNKDIRVSKLSFSLRKQFVDAVFGNRIGLYETSVNSSCLVLF